MALIFAIFLLLAVSFSPSSAATKTGWVNIKDPTFGAIGDGSHDDTTAIQAAIDYAFANKLSVYCPAGSYKTTSTIYLDPPGNLRSNWSAPTMFQFSIAFFGDPKASGALPLPSWGSCQIRPDFNNGIAFIIGPGQGMRLSDIGVVGPNNAYHGNLDPAGVGIGIAGGSGGASNTLIQNTYVRYFSALYETNANGGCCLADSNFFDNVGGNDGFVGIFLNGTQSYINTILEPVIGGTTVAISNGFSHQTQLIGGNLSSANGVSAEFTVSNTASNCGSTNLCVTAVVTSPDSYIPNVYNSFEILTPHFGLVPFHMVSWTSGTNTMVLEAPDAWLKTNYGSYSYWYNNDIFSELNAATTLYASERLWIIKGVGVELDGTHIENAGACTTLLDASSVWSGQVSSEIRNPFFDYTTSIPQDASTANKYCQQAFPFIDDTSDGLPIRLSGGNWGANGANRLIFDADPNSDIRGSHLSASNLFNFRFTGTGFQEIDATNYQLATVARGIGVWDMGYDFPPGNAVSTMQWQRGELSAPFCGYEPCPSAVPNLSPTLYALVSGSLGALGSYPPIACRTVFKSLDWNTTSPAGGKLWLRSASCPGWSWGQDLTDAAVGGTVTWSYSRGSSDLYLDAKTMGWMFPGLGILIDNGEGAQPYVVTGVYPYLGYVSVIWAGNNSGNAGGNSVGLQGGTDQVYSCASSCTIGQAAYSWTAY